MTSIKETMVTGFFLIIENIRMHSLIKLNNDLLSQKRLLDNLVGFAWFTDVLD
jgi:hypothetical protein